MRPGDRFERPNDRSFGHIAIQTPVIDWCRLATRPVAARAPLETATTTNGRAVAAATANFYAALNTMFTGDGRPMKDAWSRAEDITYMGPNGL